MKGTFSYAPTMFNWYNSLAIAFIVSLFLNLETQAQTDTPTTPPANSTQERTVPITPENELPVQTPPREISCPPGQFPSAFSDVPPNHWAYEAVVQLASPSIECFPNASEEMS